MPNLYNATATSDSSQPIATFDELRAALPVAPVNPSIYVLDDAPDFSVQVIYGSPDRDHAEVKTFTADGVERETFDTFNAATERFLSIASRAF